MGAKVIGINQKKKFMLQTYPSDASHCKNTGDSCPHCKAFSVNTVDVWNEGPQIVLFDDGKMTIEMECGICGKKWKDTYQLTGYEIEGVG